MDETFDLLSGDHFHVILHPDREHGLIFNRLDSTVTTINYDDAKELSNVKLVARVYGIVGRFLEKYLVLIKNRSKVGSLFEPSSKTNHDVYVITQVQVIDLSNMTTNANTSVASSSAQRNDTVRYDATSTRHDTNDREYRLMEMKNSDSFSSLPVTINSNSYLSAQAHANTWNPFKLASSLKPMMPTQFLSKSTSSGSQPTNSFQTESESKAPESSQAGSVKTSQADSADKRLVEEMIKLFTNTNSFYYSPTLDLTNRFARKNLIRKVGDEPVWAAADERFFWNKYMLKDLIELSRENSDANFFICVILQGFIAIQQYSARMCQFSRDIDNAIAELSSSQATSMTFVTTNSNNDNNCDSERSQDLASRPMSSMRAHFTPRTYHLALISRRSVFQAGTRYRRRGCDEDGHVANFVETEQIFKSDQHYTSLVMIRGSIPLFWYQTGYNYRPPPLLTRSEDENYRAFTKHFLDLHQRYNTEEIISIDCTEHSGREKALHDAFQRHMDKFNLVHPKTRIIQFDYHRYCRGRQCTDSQIEQHLRTCGLTEQTLKEVKYYWNDGDVVLNQEGVFRVNCLDCSDRTNVVQRIVALQILDLQLARLGIIAPDTSLEENECKKIMQTMWSANGNVLSTQYCGTRALFGGERKLAGYIKDTYSSASRYYMSKFRDVYRQAAIDAMLGVANFEAVKLLDGSSFKDQYELLSFDPFLASRQGGAILRDVGSRVTNRLARLKGRFNNVRPFGQLDLGATDTGIIHRSNIHPIVNSTGIAETGLIETFGEMSIDWPSSENINSPTQGGLQHVTEAQEAEDVFAKYANCEDNFQDDDEFSQLMLSIDIAELQRLREVEEEEASTCEADSVNESKQPEEISLKQAPCNRDKKPSSTTSSNKFDTTST